MARSRRKQGGGTGPEKLRGPDGKVLKDGLGRPRYTTRPPKASRNPLAARSKRLAREHYYDELAKERAARERKREEAIAFNEARAIALGMGLR